MHRNECGFSEIAVADDSNAADVSGKLMEFIDVDFDTLGASSSVGSALLDTNGHIKHFGPPGAVDVLGQSASGSDGVDISSSDGKGFKPHPLGLGNEQCCWEHAAPEWVNDDNADVSHGSCCVMVDENGLHHPPIKFENVGSSRLSTYTCMPACVRLAGARSEHRQQGGPHINPNLFPSEVTVLALTGSWK